MSQITEVELKFFDTNIDQIKTKLLRIGAKKVFEGMTKSYPFLKEGFCGYDSTKKYLRIREKQGKVNITYKDPEEKDSDLSIRNELELEVDEFDTAVKLIEKLGFERGKYFQKHREQYKLGNVSFEFDTLDNLPTYLEIETQTEEKMKEICELLGLEMSDGKKGTIVEIFPDLLKK